MENAPRLFQIPDELDVQIAEVYFSKPTGGSLLVDHKNAHGYFRVEGILVPVGDRTLRADISPSENTYSDEGLEALAVATIQGRGIRRFEPEITGFAQYVPEEMGPFKLEIGYIGGSGTNMMSTYVRPNAALQEIVTQRRAQEAAIAPWNRP